MKKYLFSIVLVLVIAPINAQEYQQRFIIKAGATIHRTGAYRGPIAHIGGRLSLDYFITKHIEVGFNGGYSKYKSDFDLDWDTPIATYGLELNYHFLSYLLKDENTPWDLYISGNLGGYYPFFPETMPSAFVSEHKFDYGIYAGVGYSFSNYLNPYVEIGYGELSIMELGLGFIF